MFNVSFHGSRLFSEDGEYMSFGLSGDPEHSVMIGGDVAVAWVDKETLKGYSDDYYLEGKSQCAGGRGSCPDTSIRVGSFLYVLDKKYQTSLFI